MQRVAINQGRLIELVDESGRSQRELAGMAGISEQYLCDLLAGRRKGNRVRTRVRLAAALGIERAELEVAS